MKLNGKNDRLRRSARCNLTILLLTVLVPAVVAAGGTGEAEGYGGRVTVPVLNRIEGLHPLIDRSVEAVVLQLIYNGLVVLNETLEPTPGLAESWTVSADGLAWDFALRRDVRFHDGEPLTSADVVYTLREILENPEAYSMSPLFGNIAAVEATGEYGVTITLRQPYAPLPQLLMVEILPRHLLEDGAVSIETFRKNPVGTGPFRFSSWEGDVITLTANEEYFEGRPYLDAVEIKYLHDKTRAWSELMQGKVSIVTDLDPEDYGVLASDPRFETYSYLDFFYYTVLLNNGDPLFKDRDIRMAVSLSLNRTAIIEETLRGWGDITTGPFIPGTWPYNDGVTAGLYDPDEARLLLRNAGFSDSDGDGVLDREGEKLAFELLIDEGDLLKEAVAQSVKWQLYEAGIQVDVVYLDFQSLLQQRLYPGSYQAALLQFSAAGGDPDAFTSLFWHSARIGSSNLARYGNEEVDRLIELGRTAYDQAARREVYREIHRLMAEDAASVFLFVRRIYMGANSRIDGITAQPQLFFSSAREWKIRAQ